MRWERLPGTQRSYFFRRGKRGVGPRGGKTLETFATGEAMCQVGVGVGARPFYLCVSADRFKDQRAVPTGRPHPSLVLVLNARATMEPQPPFNRWR
jgi:hypothetical protein